MASHASAEYPTKPMKLLAGLSPFLYLSLAIHIALFVYLCTVKEKPAEYSLLHVAVISEMPQHREVAPHTSNPSRQASAPHKSSPLRPKSLPNPLLKSAQAPVMENTSPPQDTAQQGIPPASPTGDRGGPTSPSADRGYGQRGPANSGPAINHDLGLRLYASQVLKIIQANLAYPANARRRNLEGKLSIRFSVDEQGNVSDIEIISSSGIPLLDKASVKTIQSCVFPPPPDKATILTVPVTFRLVENS